MLIRCSGKISRRYLLGNITCAGRSGTTGHNEDRTGSQALAEGRLVQELAQWQAALRKLRPVSGTPGLQVC